MVLLTLLQVTEIADTAKTILKEVATGQMSSEQFSTYTRQIADIAIAGGKHLLMGLVVYIIGRYVVKFIKRLVARVLSHQSLDLTIVVFIKSLVNILLTTLLIIMVISALGINTTSFTALLAAGGLAVGMALSGNLQNFAGGIIVLLFKPYRVGDFIQAQNIMGRVKEIQIFHTILLTLENLEVYIPNGAMSSGNITNFSRHDTRMIEWNIGVEYGTEVDKAEKVLLQVIAADDRFVADPAPYISVSALADSSVNILVRAWVISPSVLMIKNDFNRAVYKAFNEAGIGFPFPQITVHRAQD